MQRVDLGWAKLGKDAQRQSSKILRRKQRQKAFEEGVPALLVSKHTEMLLPMRDMHQACVEGAHGERQGVCQLARMGGFLDFHPTPDGLKPVAGSCWETQGLAWVQPLDWQRRAFIAEASAARQVRACSSTSASGGPGPR